MSAHNTEFWQSLLPLLHVKTLKPNLARHTLLSKRSCSGQYSKYIWERYCVYVHSVASLAAFESHLLRFSMLKACVSIHARATSLHPVPTWLISFKVWSQPHASAACTPRAALRQLPVLDYKNLPTLPSACNTHLLDPAMFQDAAIWTTSAQGMPLALSAPTLPCCLKIIRFTFSVAWDDAFMMLSVPSCTRLLPTLLPIYSNFSRALMSCAHALFLPTVSNSHLLDALGGPGRNTHDTIGGF